MKNNFLSSELPSLDMSNTIKMFVTIHEIEHPALFGKLQAIHNRQQRSRLLKKLATSELLKLELNSIEHVAPQTIVKKCCRASPKKPVTIDLKKPTTVS